MDLLPLDLFYRLDSRLEHRDKLSVGRAPPYPHQLPALLHIPIQEQIEAIPPGVVASFALVGTAGEQRSDDVRERRHDLCIHAAKVDPSHVFPVIHQQALPFDPGREEGEGLGGNFFAGKRHFRQCVLFAREVRRLSHQTTASGYPCLKSMGRKEALLLEGWPGAVSAACTSTKP